MILDGCRHLAKPFTAGLLVSWSIEVTYPYTRLFDADCGRSLMAWLLIRYVQQWARITARRSAGGTLPDRRRRHRIAAYILSLAFRPSSSFGFLFGVCAIAHSMTPPPALWRSAASAVTPPSPASPASLKWFKSQRASHASGSCYYRTFTSLKGRPTLTYTAADCRCPVPSVPSAVPTGAWMILIAATGFTSAIFLISAVIRNRFP